MGPEHGFCLGSGLEATSHLWAKADPDSDLATVRSDPGHSLSPDLGHSQNPDPSHMLSPDPGRMLTQTLVPG